MSIPSIVSTKQHKRLMGGYAEKSMDKVFGIDAKSKRYPFCMRNKTPKFYCRLCRKYRKPDTEIIKGMCRNCYELQRVYKDRELTKLAATRIKLAKQLHVRP